MPEIKWSAIFDRIRTWIDILVTRAYQIQKEIAPYLKKKEEGGDEGTD